VGKRSLESYVGGGGVGGVEKGGGEGRVVCVGGGGGVGAICPIVSTAT